MTYSWSDDSYSKVSKLNIGGVDYYIKDAAAREEIEKLSTYTKFLGVTTTALTDGSTTNPITIGGDSVEAKSGDIAIYGSAEFIFNGTAWAEFGDLSGLWDQLGDLAFNDEASASYTPEGSISASGTFTGSEATISVSGTTTGSVEIVADSATGNYTPIGSVSVVLNPGFTAANYITVPGKLPTFDTSLLSASVSGETITFSFVSNGFSAGILPTLSDFSAISTIEVSSASFTGQKADITFSGASATFNGAYTPVGSISVDGTFTGSAATITVEGSQSKPTT